MTKTYFARTLTVVLALSLFNLGAAFSQCVSTFPYFQNFDSGAGGWTPSLPGANGWTLGTPNKPLIKGAASAPNAWMTGAPTGLYPPNSNIFVQSPCFDFTNIANPAIKLDVWWETEYSWDGANIVVSKDNGATWQLVGNAFDPFNWYTDNSINGNQSGGPCGFGSGWSGVQSLGQGPGTWVSAQRALTGLGGEPNVRIRICFASDGSNNDDGFAFDNVVIAELPNVDLGPDTTICFGDTIFLDAGCGPDCDFKWNTAAQDTFQILPVVVGSTYLVTVTDTFGFVTRDTIEINGSPTFVNLGPDKFICPGDTVNLDAGNPWADHLWLPTGDTSQSVSINQSGSYKVIVSDSVGCVRIDSILIIEEVLPNVDLGPDTSICIGDAIILDPGVSSIGASYLWNFGNATTQTVQVTAAGTYIVTVITAAGCEARDTVVVGAQLKPVVNLGPDRVECGDFTLNANNPGSTYLWSTNQTTQSISPNGPGTYWVQVTNATGCSETDTVVITSAAIPNFSLGPDQVLCNNTPVVLDVGVPGLNYFWSTGATTQSITVSGPGLYIVNVTNADGCESTDSVLVQLSPLVVDLGPDLTICEGDTTVLLAGNQGTTYNWSTGAGSSFINVTSGGLYWVAVTDALGCLARDSIQITAQPNFNADFQAPDTAELYQAVQFTDNSGGNPIQWLWEFGDGKTSTQQNPSHIYNAVGDFEVVLTVSDGICTNEVTKDLRINVFTGLEDELSIDLRVYPNPSTGLVNFDFDMPQPRNISLAITEISGRQLVKRELGMTNSFRERLDLSGLSQGIYFLVLELPEGKVIRKLILR